MKLFVTVGCVLYEKVLAALEDAAEQQVNAFNEPALANLAYMFAKVV